MSFKPTLKDLPQEDVGYKPSLNDISQVPQYRAAPNRFIPTNIEAANQQAEMAEQSNQGMIGTAKSFGNTPQEIINAITRKKNPVPFPYSNSMQEMGGIGGDILSFLLPGEAISGTAKLASKAPIIGKGITNALKVIKESPFLRNALNIGRAGLETATMSARKNPEQSPLSIGSQGGQGAGLQALMNLALSKNPIINNLAKATIGAGGGYLAGEHLGIPWYKSIPIGIGATFGGSQVLKEMGLTGGPVSEEFLSHTGPNPTKVRLEANKKLGTAIRPSEASNNSYLGKVEGNIAGSSAGSQELAQQEAIRTKHQQSAINKLYDQIHPNTSASNKAINDAYMKAGSVKVDPKTLIKINDDPVVQAAASKVENTPAFQKKTRGIPKDSVAYLDQVKRGLDDMRESALKSGNNDEARIIGESTKELTDALDNVAPEYETARNLSQKQIVRRNIQKLMRKKEINGFQFYNTVLKNNDEYQKLYNSLANAPEAQQTLKNMKEGWDTVLSPKTARGAIHLSETSMDKARAGVQGLLNHFKDLIGAKRDIDRAKFIYSKEWGNEFTNIKKMKDEKQRRNAMIKLIGKSLGGYELNEK
jgi:hypothetical protein